MKIVALGTVMLAAGAMAAAQVPADFVRRYYAAYTARNIEALTTFYAEDATLTDPTFGVHYPNRTAFVTSLAGQIASFSKLEWQVERVIEGSDSLVVQGRLHLQARDRHGQVAFISVFTFRDGVIVRHDDYFDAVGFSTALQIVPARLAPLIRARVADAVARVLRVPPRDATDAAPR